MKLTSTNEHSTGILFAAFSYILWGFLPLYWKVLQHVPAWELLAHRILWSLVFMLVILLAMKKFSTIPLELKTLFANKKRAIGLTLASICITLNWGLYIWAVNTNNIVEASLGYYINPLVSILLGIIVLKEKLSRWQMISIIIASVGVLILTVNFGSFPWIAITLAFSFGFYGLLKKMVQLGAVMGLTIETLLLAPCALLFLSVLQTGGSASFGMDVMTTVFLIGAGVATAIPLLLFASGAKRIPLSMVGLLQYLAPTISLLLGVFLYNEPFTKIHLIAFMCIWTALTIYTLTVTKLGARHHPKFVE
ncbi:EamA family transporter RarD [Bacillus alkalisoli]|uniref:EamA family transporter RarD n=1 Tax=Bacillus alkalisoli TaxID=2011008 RepID=UPI000C23B0DC|nr:EamA family transporter RarD [Bacillus alkalisoli]